MSIFPNQLRIGDRFTDTDGEWEIASNPQGYRAGKDIEARVQRPGQPATVRTMTWPAYEKIAVRPGTATPATPSRATPEPVDLDDIDALRRELRRLRGEVLGLQEEKRELERRNAHLARELEETRKKIPRGMSTS